MEIDKEVKKLLTKLPLTFHLQATITLWGGLTCQNALFFISLRAEHALEVAAIVHFSATEK